MDAHYTLTALLSQKATRRAMLAGGMALGSIAAAPALSLASQASASPAMAVANGRRELYPSLFDPIGCLAYLPPMIRNSWFLIGYVETKAGHKFNFLVHQIVNSGPGEPLKIASILNITDITERQYRGEERVHEAEAVTLATDRMENVTPSSTLTGDSRRMRAQADFGWGALDVTADFPGQVMMNGGAGVFEFLGGAPTVQYSIPWGKGAGWLTVDGIRHEVAGTFWFDRQWGLSQKLLGQPGTPVDAKDNWVWMDLNLSNGIVLGLWDLDLTGRRYSWVTALLADGTHVVAEMEPLSEGAGAFWTSPESGKRYPTRFTVKVPALDCRLEIVAVMEAQEIVSPTQPKYEGVADITGTFKGESVTGFTLIEVVGDWGG